MVNYKEKYHFSRFRRGSKFFQGGPTFSRGGGGGSNCLFPIETQITCEFPSVFMQIRCNFPDISYLSETQKNNFQFLTNIHCNV